VFVAAAAVAAGDESYEDKSDESQEQNDEGGDDSSASDSNSHAESSTGEEATVSSLAAVSLTPSDASALHGDRNTSMTIMKDQLVGSGGGDPFGETGHHQVPVPSVNFSSFKRKEKSIHLRPNCLTVEGVVGTNAAAIAPEPEDDDNADDEVVEKQEASPSQKTAVQNSQEEEDAEGKDQDPSLGTSSDETTEDDQGASSTNDDDMFIVSSPSSEEAKDGRVSPSLLDATPLNPELKLVEPKILTSIKASQEASSNLGGVPSAISEDKAQSDPAPSASFPKAFPPQYLPTPAPLKDIGRVTSLDRPVDFDAVDWNPRDDDNESTTSTVCSVNNPFVTPDNIEGNDKEFLMDSSPKKATYKMNHISDSSFDYEGSSVIATGSAIGSAFGKGLSHSN